VATVVMVITGISGVGRLVFPERAQKTATTGMADGRQYERGEMAMPGLGTAVVATVVMVIGGGVGRCPRMATGDHGGGRQRQRKWERRCLETEATLVLMTWR
jgi:hypothetical protein